MRRLLALKFSKLGGYVTTKKIHKSDFYHKRYDEKYFRSVNCYSCFNPLYLCKISSTRYRPWDYPENFGIYSQLDRKSKTLFFTFLNVYVFWIERDKILISQLSPSKFRCFADQDGQKWGSHENEFWQFSNAKSFLNS